ncbi:MAG: HPr(Ser) kinase/phosphatase [Clostridia bacterium]|nr:HPr(Ser) kinase/phosphatase [Clostridia bacterium]
MAELSVKTLSRDLDLDILTAGDKKTVEITCVDVNRPGLFLSGFHQHFDRKRVQIIGTAEYSFLMSLTAEERRQALDDLFAIPFPFMVISCNVGPIPHLTDIAQKHGAVVLLSRTRPATRLVADMAVYLNRHLAPMITMHAELLDIYGLDILVTGDSGIGKSEAALELVKRGHRLVADDAVIIKRISETRLVGEAPETIRHMAELRGIGIINVERMYGVSAVIDSKSIDLVVHLEFWDREKDYDRLGMEQDRQDILGISVPLLTVPVHPGRNLAIIMESAARYTRLKQAGYDALDEIRERQEQFKED